MAMPTPTRVCQYSSMGSLAPTVAFRVAVIVTTAMLLSGCGGSPVGAPPPAPITPSASAAPEPSAPFPTVDLSCDELMPAATVEGLFGAPLAPQVSTTQEYFTNPSTFAVLHAGGTECVWEGSDGIRLGVSLLPHPGEGWTRYVDEYVVENGRESVCPDPSPETTTSCTGNVLTSNDVWISVLASTMSVDRVAAFDGAFASTEDAVNAAALVSPEWAPVSATALGDGCDDFVSEAEATAAFASPQKLGIGSGGGWSLEASANLLTESSNCYWQYPDTDGGPGSLAWLEGGAWAWDVAHAPTGVLADATELALPGLTANEEAWQECGADGFCSAHLIAGGNWITATAFPGEAQDAATSAAALLAAVRANLP